MTQHKIANAHDAYYFLKGYMLAFIHESRKRDEDIENTECAFRALDEYFEEMTEKGIE